MVLDKRTIFLLDGVGALVSGVFLGLVLPSLQPLVGMPVGALRALALVAVVFSVYSLSCFAFVDHGQPGWLRLLSTCNLIYCAVTLGLVVWYRDQLTLLGFLYFGAEAAIVVALVWLERRILAKLYTSSK